MMITGEHSQVQQEGRELGGEDVEGTDGLHRLGRMAGEELRKGT